MKKVLLISVFALSLTATIIGCTDYEDEQTEYSTGKDCDGSAGDKDGCPDN